MQHGTLPILVDKMRFRRRIKRNRRLKKANNKDGVTRRQDERERSEAQGDVKDRFGYQYITVSPCPLVSMS